ARSKEEESIVAMCLELHREDPGLFTVGAEQVYRTLEMLRLEPWRGQAVVLDVTDQLAGYSFLISFWSNELGGEICEIDEVFITPSFRNRGWGTSLIGAIERGELYSRSPVAITLGVTAGNQRARRLYE